MTNDRPIYIGEKVKIAPNLLTLYPVYDYPTGRVKRRPETSMANLKLKRNKNIVSKKSAQKIRNAVNWLCHSTRWKRVYHKKSKKDFYFKIIFITLTTPAEWSNENVLKVKRELLQPWLSYARVTWGLNNYIWKAERAKSGMIHFHLTADIFVHQWKLRKSWNHILQKKGYLSSYYERYGHYNAPSTEVHSVKSIENLPAELCKYLSKSDEQGQMIEGRLWACSYDLSQVNNTCILIEKDSYNYSNINVLISKVRYRDIEVMSKKYNRPFRMATCLFPTPRDWIRNMMPVIREAYQESVNLIRTGCKYDIMSGITYQ